MRASVRLVHELVADLVPADDLEALHQAETLDWLEATDDVFRRVKPDIPERHLVSYAVLTDSDDGSLLLVDHINAGLWLPPGGHIDIDESPVDAAKREAREELGVEARLVDPLERPCFLTVTRTVGIDHGHVDVSLWFLLQGRRSMPLTPDRSEFRAARWWTLADIRAEAASRFDPHLGRFVGKVTSSAERESADGGR